MIPALQPGQCAVCRWAEQGLGYLPQSRKIVTNATWTCEHDILLASTVHHMKSEELNAIEHNALMAGGDRAGAYLDEIGKTDLAQLSEEEWTIFLCRVLDGFGESMRDQLKAHSAPF